MGMLVLSRQPKESIIIEAAPGVEVEVQVLAIRGDKVRLGTSAPRHMSVHRKEIQERVKRERQAARSVTAVDVSA